MPGDPLWSEEFTTAFAGRWAGWDRMPYDAARLSEEEVAALGDADETRALALTNLALSAENQKLKAQLMQQQELATSQLSKL